MQSRFDKSNGRRSREIASIFYELGMKRLLPFGILVLTSGLTICQLATAADWPMYRNDAGRRGVIEDNLPLDLALSWMHKLPKLTPAFKDKRLHFDAGYEPVIAKGILLIASSLTDSVKAYDANSGEECWSFYTNGPVRFAPAISGDFACFGSDDGCLYCVELATGELHWKYCAVPSQRRLLGNRRLISVWPVRGGPVVADGKVYFAAGVWPFEGVFVYAMDLASGKVLWRNDSLGYLWGHQPHNTTAIGGLAPQGYLLVNGNELIVPCSTAYPARLNRLTGELIEFDLPKLGRYPGGWFAALDPETSRAIRHGKLTFDEVINQHRHEDKVQTSSGGSKGLSREIRIGKTILNFDDPHQGVEGIIHSMVVADRALYMTTRDGRLMCFRQEAPEVANTWKTEATLPTIADHTLAKAKAIVEKASSSHGLAIVAGVTDGSLTNALLESSDYHVVVFDDDRERVNKMRQNWEAAGWSGSRVAVIHCELPGLSLPPYVTTLLLSERSDVQLAPLLHTLRPFGGLALSSVLTKESIKAVKLGNFTINTDPPSGLSLVRRVGPLPGATQYLGDFSASKDELVRFPLGVLWFDDTLAHFKRSPQPVFDRGTMISRPKNWDLQRPDDNNKIDYPLLPPVLTDIYTGRVLEASERPDLRKTLDPSSPSKLESSQYRTSGQPFSTKAGPVNVGQRINPLTRETERRLFPKTYGCDGGVDYGDFYTLRSGTAAYYDKTIESGTVFLSGPRSGCTNSIIPSGGLLNVPYYYDGCTCSYPLPVAMALVAMPQHYEQWSSWGKGELKPGSIERIGINFGAPGDRMTRGGTLWLDYPSIGGPSPKIDIEVNESTTYCYRHSVWMQGSEPLPWVCSSMAKGLDWFVLKGLKAGSYLARIYFTEPQDIGSQRRLENIILQGRLVATDSDVVDQAGGMMRGTVKEFANIVVKEDFTLELSETDSKTSISGIELILRD